MTGGYYVTALHGERLAPLAGPYATESDARARVATARSLVGWVGADPFAEYGYGVSRFPEPVAAVFGVVR